jgi:hypothetical protein
MTMRTNFNEVSNRLQDSDPKARGQTHHHMELMCNIFETIHQYMKKWLMPSTSYSNTGKIR